MIRLLLQVAICGALAVISLAAEPPTPRVLAFYATNVESDHVEFANQALRFFTEQAHKHHFQFDSTTHWEDMNPDNLSRYQLVIWLNDFPHTQAVRDAFQQYMTKNGAWLGFHVTAYNDKDTHWPWFVDFLGGAVFYSNNWPPLPARLTVDDPAHLITQHIPTSFLAPANEWYIWNPSPRLQKDVKVLVTLDPANYPLGLKDTLTGGDLPVVWTNTHYRMVYINMGHGDKIFSDAVQNQLFENTLLYLLQRLQR